MAPSQRPDKILVVNEDPDVLDLIAHQTLRPLGFQVQTAELASVAIQQALRFSPDVMIASMKLPDLSGKDLLVALAAQGVQIPVIIVTEKGKEAEIIQAFRLGAADYLPWPVRETEVLSAVERVLRTVHNRREREELAGKLQAANQSLQRRVRELTTIFAIGKAVTSITDQQDLFDKIIEGAVQVTEADSGWLMLRDDRQNNFVLAAFRNVPKSMASKIHQPIDDGISGLVALSGETLAIHGQAIRRFKISRMGSAAMVAPLKAQKEVIGLMVTLRKRNQPFGESAQTLLEAVADYAAISLLNARLFRVLETRAQRLQTAVEEVNQAEKVKSEILQNISHELRTPMVAAKGYVDVLVDGQMGALTPEQQQALTITQEKLQRVVEIIQVITTLQETVAPKERRPVNMGDLVQKTIRRFHPAAQRAGVTLGVSLPAHPLTVMGDTRQIEQALSHLLTNAIKFSPEGGQVKIGLRLIRNGFVQTTVKDTGIGINQEQLAHVFDRFYQVDGSTTRRFNGLGVGLALVKDIVEAHGGRVWAESEAGRGSTFHFILPQA